MTFLPVVRTRRTQRRLVIAGVLAVFCLFISLVALSQEGPGATSQLKGKTKEVTPVPDGVVDAGPVVFKKDSDNDGMSDDDERDNGTNPDDPSDADADNDGDGMSNGDEVALGSNPNATDTDGDGVSDADEVRLGYDPTDPNNTPPSGSSLASLRVSPSSVFTSINTLLGYEPVQLLVTGVLADGTTVDLTGGPTLTFQSLDSSVAVVDDFGSVSAVDAGATTIKVNSGTVSADVPVVITTITPGPRSSIAIPGYANNVDVSGNYVYVAAGSAGLVVVDASDRSAPTIVATLSTPGNANDVRVVGTTAYVADGFSGLQIVDVGTPASPSIRGSLDTPGEANDVVIYGALAYVADGPSGIQIINVSNPSAPTLVGSTDTPGLAKGIDVSGDLIVVADDQPGSVVIIDAAIPASPQIVGSVTMPGYALDLEVRDRFAYVAAFTGGMQVIDFSIPASPRIIASIENLFYPRDVALGRRYAVAAEVRFFNAVPIIDLGDPSNPIYSGVVDFSELGDFQGTGIAVDAQHIYMTGSNDPFNTANGVSGSTRLFIGEYLQPENEVSDTAGVAPQVSMISPQSGQSANEGDRLPISITATDDVRVALVQLIVNGVVVIKDVAAPYSLTYSVPHGVTSLTIEAKAFDVAGNAATSPPVTINVLPDPPPTITITNPAEGDVLTEHEEITLVADAIDNSSVAQVVFTVNGDTLNNFSLFTVPTGITSLTFAATATDNFGNTASTTRTVTVIPDGPPTITITSPAEGQVLTEHEGITLIADATDNSSVAQVVFTVNGDTLNNFSSFTVPTGITSVTFEATATDNLGQSASTTRTLSVVPDPPPTISITNPAEGQQLYEEQDLYLQADVNDNGYIQSVVFSVNGTPLADSYYRVPTGVTSLTFEATATDNFGKSASTTRTVTVIPDPPPTIAITSPAEGQQLFEEQDLYLAVDVTDNGNIQSVVFSVNGTPLDDSYYQVPTGVTSLTFGAIVTDDRGNTASATRTVSVVPDTPPTINIVSPAEGAQFVEGVVVEFAADATDNILVSQVEFTVNGTLLPADLEAPYTQSYTIPLDTTSLVLEATATDNLGHTTMASRTFNVVPDPGTTVTGQVVDTSAQSVSGATVTVFGEFSTQTGADGHFAIADVPTVRGDILARVTAVIGGQATANASLSVPPVSGGATDVGVVTVSVSPTAPTAFGVADYDGDFVPDVFVGYPDRQSLIYSLSGGQFTPSTSRLLPFGAVRSGTNLELHSSSQRQIFAQLAGRPGSVTDVSFDSGAMQEPRTLATGLAVESEYTAAGLDTAQAQSDATHKAGDSLTAGNLTANSVGSNRTLLAFLKNGSGGTSLTVRFGDDSEAGYGDPVALPVDPAAQLRSLTLFDINRDGLQDVLVIKPVTGTDANLVVYLRISASAFGDPIESPVTVRTTVPAKGAIDFALGRLALNSFQTDIAVLGDDRVRIYRGDGVGAFVFEREVALPAGMIPTGLTTFDVSRDQRSDLIVTITDVNLPTSKFALIYFNSGSGIFQSPISKPFTAPVSSGDTRSAIGEWGGSFQQSDLIVVDGETITIFLDVGPANSSS